METVKYLNKEDLELIHFTQNLFFYRYVNWSGLESRIYIASKEVDDPEITYSLNSEEFGFIEVKTKAFKMTEDVWLDFDEIKDIVEFLKELKDDKS